MINGTDNEWVGRNEWRHQAARGLPPLVAKSLTNNIDISDSAILLKSNYVTLYDFRKTTDVALEAPSTASWGGNFATYTQHKAYGKAHPTFGTLTGAFRAQLETTQEQNGAPINDASTGYLGLYNNGTDVGGFGLHVDAYHAGMEVNGHSTYAMSAECWKQYANGRMAAYVARAQQGVLDFGLVILHSGGSFKTGIALGCPSYGMGGIQGAPGTPTQFDIGIDLSLADCKTTALRLAPPCDVKFEAATGFFAIRNGDANVFDVNMSNGIIWQNAQPTWAAFSPTVDWAFSVGPGKTTSDAPSATPVKWMRVLVDGEPFLMPLYRP
jgi:hypothetical protein